MADLRHKQPLAGSRVAHLGLSDSEEDVIVSFMQILTDGFTSTLRPNAVTA
jgi:hypothetical protein